MASGDLFAIALVVLFPAALGVVAGGGEYGDAGAVGGVPVLVAVGTDGLAGLLDEFLVGGVVVVDEDAAEEEDLNC